MHAIVIALGGNTLLGKAGPWTLAEQIEVMERTAEHIASVARSGYRLVLTHGNGPQVGDLLLQQENTPQVPQLPLDVLVAETQAQIGYLLQRSLDNALAGDSQVATVITQVAVDPEDPAFDRPLKPVGPYYSDQEASAKPFPTLKMAEAEHGYRRVVPSPEPAEIIENAEIARSLADGSLVICAGGGGIPVVRNQGLEGVAAVIDKDKTSQLLASFLEAGTLVILTDVEAVYVGYGQPGQRALEAVSANELRRHLDNNEFQQGSMKPKVEAALRFVEGGGDLAIITAPDKLAAALDGRAGTRVRRTN